MYRYSDVCNNQMRNQQPVCLISYTRYLLPPSLQSKSESAHPPTRPPASQPASLLLPTNPSPSSFIGRCGWCGRVGIGVGMGGFLSHTPSPHSHSHAHPSSPPFSRNGSSFFLFFVFCLGWFPFRSLRSVGLSPDSAL